MVYEKCCFCCLSKMTRRTIRAVSYDSARQKSREPGSNQEALKSKKPSSHAFPTKAAAWSPAARHVASHRSPSCCMPPIAVAPAAAFPSPAPAANLSSGYLHGIGSPAFSTSRLGRSGPSRRMPSSGPSMPKRPLSSWVRNLRQTPVSLPDPPPTFNVAGQRDVI